MTASEAAPGAPTAPAAALSARPVAASAIVGLVAALVFGPWFPPAADGAYFDKLGRRIAEGAGYTWAWPDGAVTPVAHYPVGFSALEAVGYRLFGSGPVFARLTVAALAVLAVAAGMRLLAPAGVRAARVGGWLLALHPALVFYLPAMMTEGLVGSLVVIAGSLAVDTFGARQARTRLLAGASFAVVLAAATYLRPQSLVFAPLFAFSAALSTFWVKRRRLLFAGAAGAVGFALVLALLAPWTARNCVRMHSCAVVSVNGGWNLLIGAETTSGAWQELATPDDCRTVWDEAAKDACFGRVAVREIEENPLAWLARAPAKWSTTFDYFGAAPFYLHAANPVRFGDTAKERLGALETIFCRLVLLAALFALARIGGPLPRARVALAVLATPFVFLVHAWPAYLAVGVLAAVLAVERSRVRARPRAPLFAFASLVILATFVIHAVFFGAGRYGLPAADWVALLAALVVVPRSSTPHRRSPARGLARGREESPSSGEHDAG